MDGRRQRAYFLAINKDIELLVSDLTIANMRYITRKEIPLSQFYHVILSKYFPEEL